MAEDKNLNLPGQGCTSCTAGAGKITHALGVGDMSQG